MQVIVLYIFINIVCDTKNEKRTSGSNNRRNQHRVRSGLSLLSKLQEKNGDMIEMFVFGPEKKLLTKCAFIMYDIKDEN